MRAPAPAGGGSARAFALGEDGIVGLKTGSTSAAGGCVLLAARSHAGHRRSLIVVAVFGQLGTRTQSSQPL